MIRRLLYKLKIGYRSLSQPWMLALLLVGLMLPNVLLLCSPFVGVMAGIAGILIPLGVYMILLTLCRRPGRVVLVWLPLLLLINAFQLVLFSVFWGEIIAVDMLLNLFSASGDEAGELLGGLIIPILLVLLTTIGIIVLARKSWRSAPMSLRLRRRTLRLGLGISLVGLLPMWAAHYESPAYSFRAGVYPFNIFYNMYVAGGKLREVARYSETSASFSYDATSERSPELREVYVFVLGETSRAYSWQLYGYPRETNPRLGARRSELVVYHDLTTQSNTTYKSVPILLSPADGEHTSRLPEVKGLLTALKESGYYTVYITNQPENRSFVDFFAYEADEHYRIRDLIRAEQGFADRRPVYDTDMLPYLDRVLSAEHTKLFVVLHTYGAHWSYRDRYPAEAAYFTPDDAMGANAYERGKLVNAYDNAIRYTDHLLGEVIDRLEHLEATTAMYYTADHGEDVYDDERGRILHSSPSVSYYQLHVPGILWLSPEYRAHFPQVATSAQANADAPATSRSNLHTLLGLMGISTPERVDALSLVSPTYDRSTPRTYLNDRYECVPLSEMITHPRDLEQWTHMRLAPIH